jgi:hypothetical protein
MPSRTHQSKQKGILFLHIETNKKGVCWYKWTRVHFRWVRVAKLFFLIPESFAMPRESKKGKRKKRQNCVKYDQVIWERQ